MNLAVILSLGESFTDLKRSGQDQLMITQNIESFSKVFDHVYVFTYKREKVKLPKNCTLIIPPFKLHRYLYALAMPFIHFSIIKKCQLLRPFQLSGTIPAIVARIFFNKKYVFNLGYDYTAFAQIENKPLQAFFYKLLQPLATALAVKVIVKNKSLISMPYALCPKQVYIPNGVDTNLFKPKQRSPNKAPRVLFIGRLEPQKNILNFIRAVSNLKTNTKLTIIGSGSQKAEIINLSKKLKINLKLISHLPHQKLPSIYQTSDIFVLPSIKEGSPKVLLEAMSCGLPCIVSKIPEHRSIITHQINGWLTDTDPGSIASSLNHLLQAKSLQARLKTNARKLIMQKYNISQIMNKELKLLRTAV